MDSEFDVRLQEIRLHQKVLYSNNKKKMHYRLTKNTL